MAENSPVRALEHSHTALSRLVVDVGRLVRSDAASEASGEALETLTARLEELRDELLEHFANEEEALFPFLRANVPNKIAAVDRLEAGHDAICGAIVRLDHLAARSRTLPSEAAAFYERFEHAYAAHSRDEAELFEELGRTLTDDQHRALAELLRGLG
jgi:iron-sulfur cluster repair protein YtfE (RIC family)